ncbi:MAG: hypothetical protein LBJ93_03900 [Clostridiales bacterium]|nr:hypothetical protein [Clostridiales bacterium]
MSGDKKLEESIRFNIILNSILGVVSGAAISGLGFLLNHGIGFGFDMITNLFTSSYAIASFGAIFLLLASLYSAKKEISTIKMLENEKNKSAELSSFDY